eukprot:TRINITY_DN21058_c1_g1_i3.p2 TRINITY_DN21058_c1_g1~~TRINITY_DN21058_c1_g1_i3.p2  ORF type:complete len:227 (-),score=32.27 TRINITY_DN21058_c1_g1_i3:173-853(-)
MPFEFYYSSVARTTTVLVEESIPGVSANIGLLTQKVLEKLSASNPPDGSRLAYAHEKYWYHILTYEGFTFLCIVDEKAPKRLIYAYLEDISHEFVKRFKDRAQHAIAYEYNSEYAPVMKEKMTFYSTNPNADQLDRMRMKVSNVKEVMVSNIQKVLERGEKLDNLQNKTDELEEQSNVFKRKARGLRQTMWQRYMRYAFLSCIAAFIVAYLIFAVICGPTGYKCGI